MELSNLEKALLHAARAFISVYSDSNEQTHDTLPTPPQRTRQNAPTATSNDIPVCSVHGKAMRESKYGKNQYYCGAKLDDGTYCRQKAYMTQVE